MPFDSKTTLRVFCIPAGASKENFEEFEQKICGLLVDESRKTALFGLSRIKGRLKPGSRKLVSRSNTEASTQDSGNTSRTAEQVWRRTTFARQRGQMIGTISFKDAKTKDKALLHATNLVHSKWLSWCLSPTFKRLTVLYECPEIDEIDVDVCAVHGLGGNAFDTWTAKNKEMWLRDFLPSSTTFRTSRIMTFGYDCDLSDTRSVMTLENWAESLLYALNDVRTSDTEKRRPLILVAHSLGGLVIRKALAQIPNMESCDGITPEQCGAVFLATPHSGSTKADWDDFLVAFTSTLAGFRADTLKLLRTFNPGSVWDKKAFLNLNPRPQFLCFAEGVTTRVKGTNQYFSSSQEGSFEQIHSGLEEVLKRVKSAMNTPQASSNRRMFGHPRYVPPVSPPANNHWWEGNRITELRYQVKNLGPFVGRSKELQKWDSISRSQSNRPRLTIVKGIGGIGKTEFLLKIAAAERENRSVFFFRPAKTQDIGDALAEVSTRIGADMFDGPTRSWEKWETTTATERVQAFIDWLGNACNKNSLLIVDDVEAFGYANIELIMKYPAWHIVVSTRDSELMRSDRHCEEVHLSCLSNDETVKILLNTLNRINSPFKRRAHPTDLTQIADKIQGHPLAARNAISFIMTRLSTYSNPFIEFSTLLDSSCPEDRKAYLQYTFEGRSLSKAFDTSVDRLALLENTGNAIKLAQVLPFLCVDRDCIDDFLKGNKYWLNEKDLPDLVVLNASYRGSIAGWLSHLRRVSFYINGESLETVKRIDMHPLVAEYILLHLDEERRVRLATQILRFCYQLQTRGVDRDSQLIPHVHQCAKACERLGVSIDTLRLSEDITQWVSKILSTTPWEEGKSWTANWLPSHDQTEAVTTAVKELGARCKDANQILRRIEDFGLSDGVTDAIMNCIKSYRKVRDALNGAICGELANPLKQEIEKSVAMLYDMVISKSNNAILAEELGRFMEELKCKKSSG